MNFIITTQDELEANRIVKSFDMACFIFNLQNISKNHLKYSDYTEEQYKIVEKVFEDIFNSLNDYNILIDNLIE